MCLCLCALAAVRIVAITLADRAATNDPRRALGWLAQHPQALLTLAERQLEQGNVREARASARRLLIAEPLEGRGFRVLAASADHAGDRDLALALYEIAARRSPRDTPSRAWLAEHYLLSGNYPASLAQIDAILRKVPSQERVLAPLLSQLSADPAFTAALVRMLGSRPVWRGPLLSSMQASTGIDAVMTGLQQSGGLSEAEFDQWIASLMSQGRWGEAYALWASAHPAPRLPLVYNGDFLTAPSGRGFDWRVTRVPAIELSFLPGGRNGFVAQARFRRRPVAQLNLEHPLLLAPGPHRLTARIRTQALSSEQGLEWRVVCDGAGTTIGASAGISGTTGWHDVIADIDVPARGCRGQWLRLHNPAPTGSAQVVDGALWIDGVAIAGNALPGVAVARLQIERGAAWVGDGAAFTVATSGAALSAGQQLMLGAGSSAHVVYTARCAGRFTGPAVQAIAAQCDGTTSGNESAGRAASDIAAGLQFEQAIVGSGLDRASQPAGR